MSERHGVVVVDSNLGQSVTAARHVAEVQWLEAKPEEVVVTWSSGKVAPNQFPTSMSACEFRDALVEAMKAVGK